MTKAQKKKITESMLKRWQTIIAEDHTCDGYWEDIADALGHGDVSGVSTEAALFGDKLMKATTKWLARLPEVA